MHPQKVHTGKNLRSDMTAPSSNSENLNDSSHGGGCLYLFKNLFHRKSSSSQPANTGPALVGTSNTQEIPLYPLQTAGSGTAASTLNAESSVNPNNSPPLQPLASAPVLPQETPTISKSVTQAESFAPATSPSHSQDGDVTITKQPLTGNDPNPLPAKSAMPQVGDSVVAKASVNDQPSSSKSVTVEPEPKPSASAIVTISHHSHEAPLRDILLSALDVPDWTLKVRVPVDMPSSEFPIALFSWGQYHYNKAAEETKGPSRDLVKTLLIIYQEVLQYTHTDTSFPLKSDQLNSTIFNLSALYVKHFCWSRQASDLDKGIAYLRQFISLSGFTKEEEIHSIRNLAVCMVRPGYWETHATEYLNHAISLYTEVMMFQKAQLLSPPPVCVPQTADSSTDITYTLDELAYCYKSRFEQLVTVEDLDLCIQLIHEHMNLCPHCKTLHPACRHVWGNLAGAYGHRSTELKTLDDLNEAIRLFQQCLDCWKANSVSYPDGGLWYGNLSNVLTQRFTMTKQREDIDKAIEIDQEALTVFKPDDNRYHTSLSHLGNSLMIRSIFYEEGTDEDLDESIHAFQKVGTSRKNLASAFELRFKKKRNPEDWKQSLHLLNQELDSHNPHNPHRAACLSQLAMLYIMDDAPEYNMATALQYRLEALEDDAATPQGRLGNSAWMFNHINIKTLDTHTRSLLLKVLITTMHLLPRAADFSMNLNYRLEALQREDEVVIQAASQALVLDQPGLALEIMEEGRAIFWTQTLRLRGSFEHIPEPLQSRLIQQAQELDSRSVNASIYLTSSKFEIDADSAHRRRLDKEFNKSLEEARQLGFEPYSALTISASELQDVAKQGPVVVLLATSSSCDAIVVSQMGAIQRLSLSITAKALERVGEKIKDVGRAARDGSFGNHKSDRGIHLSSMQILEQDGRCLDELGIEELVPSREVPTSSEDKTQRYSRTYQPGDDTKLLDILWVKVVQPIIGMLNLKCSSGHNRPRLWWCPTGPFTFVPIHAATKAGNISECCSAYVVSSYTPTLRSLLDSRCTYQQVRLSDVRALAAAVPKGYTATTLPNTMEEVKRLEMWAPTGTVLPLASGDGLDTSLSSNGLGPTVQMILDNIPKATILHLACHGMQDPAKPLESGFIMQDGLLKISQLMSVSHPGAFMAFLSACETAKGDKTQPDQAVHLASAMLLAGFKSIVATMWSMNDRDGPVVADVIYEQLFTQAGNSKYLNPDDVAYALDTAVTKLKQAGAPPVCWAPYIHIGM
ncbi:CHAT domain-containing protein [Mycena epipterygia]|nr:CHAT domain-containing protein [Mycena epipterygia]